MREPPWTDADSWHRYVIAPQDEDVHPARMWMHEDCGVESSLPLTLTCAHTDRPARAVIDYGYEITGRPWFQVAEATDRARLLAGYSEALRYLTPRGDLDIDGLRVSGNPQRHEVYVLTGGPGHIRQRFVQGGFRYQMLSLEQPGSATLVNLGVTYTAYRGTPGTYAGWFDCSDGALTRTWYAGTHTLHLSMLPAGDDAGYWAIEDGALDAQDAWTDPNATSFGLMRLGPTWATGSVEVDVQTRRGTASVLLRGRRPGVGVAVGVSVDAVEVAVRHAVGDDARHVLRTWSVPPAGPRAWRRLRLLLDERSLRVDLADRTVGSVDLSVTHGAIPSSGRLGLAAAAGDHARFRDLRVQPAGETEMLMRLDSSRDLDAFDRPGVTTLPVILDGAKRDRLVWQGDNLVSAHVLFACSDETEYVRDSIALLGAHQLASGYVPANVNPAATLTDHAPRVDVETAQYPSSSYSLYFILNLYDYWLHTGDVDFVRSVWPTVCRELQWNESRAGPDGLLQTDGRDGMGWRYSFVCGTPGYENALYVEALRRAASMAVAVGDNRPDWTDRAERVHGAFRRLLIDAESGVVEMTTELRGHVTLDANATALLHNLLEPDDTQRVIDAVLTRLATPAGLFSVSEPPPAGQFLTIGPMMLGVFLWALAAHGRTEEALELVRRVWLPMVDGDPGMTVWEVLGADGTLRTPGINGSGEGNTSLAHPWSGAPTALASEYILGVRPVEPGYVRWLIEPRPAGLSWANGRIPTPFGPIDVAWTQADNGFSIEVIAPVGTSGRLVLPRRDLRYHVRWSAFEGVARWPDPTGPADLAGSRAAEFDVSGGGHLVVWSVGDRTGD